MANRDPQSVLSPRHKLFSEWASCFTRSVRYAVDGDCASAREEFGKIDGKSLAFWFHTVAQYGGSDRLAVLDRAATARSAVIKSRARMPNSRQTRDILERDQWSCRYCESPLLLRSQLDKFRSLIGEDLFPLGRTNLSKHGAYFLHVATIDHIVPWSAGGTNESDNLAATCHACNFGKDDFTFEELSLDTPSAANHRKNASWVKTVEDLDGL